MIVRTLQGMARGRSGQASAWPNRGAEDRRSSPSAGDALTCGRQQAKGSTAVACLQDQQFRRYIQEAAGSQSSADQLAKLADMRDRGVITAEEFDPEKAKILA